MFVTPAMAQPPPVMASAFTAMTDVLNSEAFTRAGWRTRMPTAARVRVLAIAMVGNLLLGYGLRTRTGGARLLLILPLVVATAFMLIADVDAPRRGVIRVSPQNLLSLVESLRTR